jgi:hypothetical protein
MPRLQMLAVCADGEGAGLDHLESLADKALVGRRLRRPSAHAADDRVRLNAWTTG